MINLSAIRNPIVKGLRDSTGLTTIIADQSAEQPPYPFIGLKFTTTGLSVGQAAEGMEGYDATIEQDLELVLSATSYSDDLDESFNNAQKALAWFKGAGWLSLSDVGITIVRTEPMTNRDTFLSIEYERRHGFDVRLRVKGKAEYEVDIIEQVITNRR